MIKLVINSMKKNIKYDISIPEKSEYFKLFVSSGWNEDYNMTADELISTLKNSWFCVSAYDQNTLIGFGRILSDGLLHAMIFDMIVLPEYQYKGIGNEILKRLLGKCKEHKIRDIQLFSAKGKMDFYKKNGFITRPIDAQGMEIKNKY